MEEEQTGRADLQRLVQKANSEAAMWRQKCESGEGGVRSVSRHHRSSTGNET